MNGPTETQEVEINLAPLASARVAYTINNQQPVKSSFIGSEPFFFMDTDEDIEEDEGLFDDFSIDMITSELEELKGKIDAYDAISREFHEDDTQITALFDEQAEFVTSGLPDQSSLPTLIETLEQSRFADTLIDYAKNHGIEICYSTHVKTSEYDRQAEKIFVHPSIDMGYQVLSCAKELRRVWQHKQGAAVDPMAFYPDHGILINRLQQADMDAFMVRIAWELKLANSTEAWSYIENSNYADLGRAFAREACTDFRATNNGEALLGMVEAWFLSERCRNHDRTLIQRMLAGNSPEGFSGSQDLSRQALIEAIYALGKNPYGNNYLSAHIQLLVEDPIFSEVRDRSNANFLWFVKFESSFAQAEQELQLDQSTGEKSSTNQQDFDGHEAQLITFPKRNTRNEQREHNSTGECTVLPFSIRES